MKLPPHYFSNPFNGVKGQTNFGAKVPSLDDLKNIKKIADCQTGNMVTEITEGIKNFATKQGKSVEKFLRKEGGELLPKSASKL